MIAVRGDFWDRCAAYPELASALQDGQFLVGPMTEPDLRLAITGPAQEAGLQIDPALTDTIISDLRSVGVAATVGVLPLLSQAMRLTWENRDGSRLTSRGYAQAGGIALAVQASADAVYDNLAERQQALARDLLRAMAVIGRDGRVTRRPVNRAGLCSAHPGVDRAEIGEVLDAFAARRLIVLDNGTAQLAHDSLLAAWPRLRGWLDEDQASWVLHGQLADDVAAWRENSEDRSFLYRGAQLAAVRQAVTSWAASPSRYPALTADERAGRQRRATVLSLVLLLIAVAVFAGIAGIAETRASQQRTVAQANEMAAEATSMFSVNDPLAMQLSLQAFKRDQTPQTTSAVIQAGGQPLEHLLGQNTNQVSAVAYSPDGQTLAAGYLNGDVALWNTGTGKEIRVLPGGLPGSAGRLRPR